MRVDWMGWDGMGWVEVRLDGMVWNWIGMDLLVQDGVGLDGMGWDGVGLHEVPWGGGGLWKAALWKVPAHPKGRQSPRYLLPYPRCL